MCPLFVFCHPLLLYHCISATALPCGDKVDCTTGRISAARRCVTINISVSAKLFPASWNRRKNSTVFIRKRVSLRLMLSFPQIEGKFFLPKIFLFFCAGLFFVEGCMQLFRIFYHSYRVMILGMDMPRYLNSTPEMICADFL